MRIRDHRCARVLGWVLLVACALWLVWPVPGHAVDVVRKSARQAKVDPPPTPKEKESTPADTSAESVRGLLNNVRSQKEAKTPGDTLDAWIDRDGDGVNDRLKKSAAPEGTRIKGFQPAPASKKSEPTKPTTTPKKTKSKTDSSPAKKRHR